MASARDVLVRLVAARPSARPLSPPFGRNREFEDILHRGIDTDNGLCRGVPKVIIFRSSSEFGFQGRRSGKQLTAMTDRSDPERPEIFCCQFRQDILIDVVVAERLLVR